MIQNPMCGNARRRGKKFPEVGTVNDIKHYNPDP